MDKVEASLAAIALPSGGCGTKEVAASRGSNCASVATSLIELIASSGDGRPLELELSDPAVSSGVLVRKRSVPTVDAQWHVYRRFLYEITGV